MEGRYKPSNVAQEGGLSRYLRTELPKISTALEWITERLAYLAGTLVSAGYGSIRGDLEAMPDLGAGWVVVPFDSELITAPVGVSYDLASNALIVDRAGVWMVTVDISLEHNDINDGRLINARVWNIDEGRQEGYGFEFGTGRNSPVTDIFYAGPFELADGVQGARLRLELGDGDAYTGVVLHQASWGLVHVSAYGG